MSVQIVNNELVELLKPFFSEYGRWSLISETTLSSPTGSVTFSAIPQNFKSLVLVMSVRSSQATEGDSSAIRFNGDTGANYDWVLWDYSTAAGGGAYRAQTCAIGGITEAANSTASAFSGNIVFIPNYADANIFKSVMPLPSSNFGNVSADTDCSMRLTSGKWRSTAPITSIVVYPYTGPNWATNCIFQLYGIL